MTTQVFIKKDDHYTGMRNLKVMDRLDSKRVKLTLLADIVLLLEQLRTMNVKKVTVDLTQTEWLGSRGVISLIKLQHELREQNMPLILRNPNTHLKNIFRIMQLEQSFVFESSDDAMALVDNSLQPIHPNPSSPLVYLVQN